MDDALHFSPVLNRTIRHDAPEQLGEPTVSRLLAAMSEGRSEKALEWFCYLLTEHVAIHDLFGVWNRHMVRYYLNRAGGGTWPELVQQSMAPWVGATVGIRDAAPAHVEIHRQSAILSLADLAWQIHLSEDPQAYTLTLGTASEQEDRWTAQRQEIEAAIQDGATRSVEEHLESQLRELRLVHDILCDWAWALLTVIARRWGEQTLDEVLRVTEEPWVTPRYEKLRDLGHYELLQLTVEGMRGHFSGPERSGSIEVREEPDRYVLRFDACGTGGRMRRGDPVAGSGSRLGPPYNFLNVEGSYGWTWGRKGVCAYCAHCAVVNQILPIEGLGFPMRMTLYPERPEDPCHWIIYKDRSRFPEEAYQSVGKDAPA